MEDSYQLTEAQRAELQEEFSRLLQRTEDVEDSFWTFDMARDRGHRFYAEHILDRLREVHVLQVAIEDLAHLDQYALDPTNVMDHLHALTDLWSAAAHRVLADVRELENVTDEHALAAGMFQATRQLRRALTGPGLDPELLVEAIEREAALSDVEDYAVTWKDAVNTDEHAVEQWFQEHGFAAFLKLATARTSARYDLPDPDGAGDE